MKNLVILTVRGLGAHEDTHFLNTRLSGVGGAGERLCGESRELGVVSLNEVARVQGTSDLLVALT
eukprot:6604673-Prymnesium_polylepis.3